MTREDLRIRYVLDVEDKTQRALVADRKVRESAKETGRVAQSSAKDQVAANKDVERSSLTRAQKVRQAQAAEVKALRESGKSYRQIGQEMGFSESKARSLISSTDRLTTSQRANARASANAEGGFTRLGKSLRDTNTNFTLFRNTVSLIRWPALIAGAGGAAQGLSAAAGGAAALAAGLAPLAGAAAAGAQGLTALGQAAGALGLATSGVSEAIKASITDQQKAGTAALQSAQQQRGAAEAVRSAKLSLADAQRSARFAQEGLTQARFEATRQLDDMRAAADRANLTEKRAALSLRQARKDLREGLDDPKSSRLELQDLRLRVREAQADLSDTRTQASRAREDARRAERGGGVGGLDQVVAARRALADAQNGVAESARSVRMAQLDASEAMDKQSSSAGALQTAMDDLSPAAQHFVQTVVELKPRLDELRATAAQGLFPGVEEGLKSAMGGFGRIQDIVGQTSSLFGDFAARAGKKLGSEGFGRDLSKIGASNVKVMRSMGGAALHLGDAFTDVVVAARPLTEWIAKSSKEWAANIEKTIGAARANGDLSSFLRETREAMTQVGGIAGGLANAFLGIGKAAYPLGSEILRDVNVQAQNFGDWANSIAGQNSLAQYFEDIKGPLYETGLLLRDVTKAFFDLGTGSGLEKLIHQARTKLLPVLTDVIKTTTASFGPHLIRALTKVTKLFGDLAGTNGPLNLFVDTIGNMAKGMHRLFKEFPLAKEAVVFMLGAGSIYKALDIAAAVTGLKGLTKLLGTSSLGMGKWGTRLGKIAGRGLIAGIVLQFGQPLLDEIKKRTAGIRTDIYDAFAETFSSKAADFFLGGRPEQPRIPASGSGGVHTFDDLGIKERADNFTKDSERVRKWGDYQRQVLRDSERDHKQHIEKVKGALYGGENAFEKYAKGGTLSLKQFEESADRSSSDTQRNITTRAKKASADGTTSFRALAKNSKTSMGNMRETTNSAIAQIGSSINKALRGLGADPVNLSAAGGKLGEELAKSGKSEKKARGGFLKGRGLRDTVPVMAAPGEAFLTRHDQPEIEQQMSFAKAHGVGRAGSLREQFSGHRRPHYMAKGGFAGSVVQALGPYNIAPFSYDANHAGGNSHWHIAMSSSPAVVAVGKRLQQMGFSVSEHPAFGGIQFRHDPGGHHYTGQAIDVNSAADETEAETRRVASLLLGGAGGKVGLGLAGASVAQQIRRLLIKGPNGALKNLAQGGADTVRRAANEFLSKQGPKMGALAGGAEGRGKIAGGSPLSIGQKMAATAGWTGGEWSALRELWTRESGWNPRAENPSSGAYGIPQSLPATKMASAGKDWRTNPATQIRWGIGYIKDRYGSPSSALSFHDSHNWYARGGKVKDVGWFGEGGQFIVNGPTVFGAGERPGQPELVTVQPMARGGFSASEAGFPTGSIRTGNPNQTIRTIGRVGLNDSSSVLDKFEKQLRSLAFDDLIKLLKRSSKHVKDVDKKLAKQYQKALDAIEARALGKAESRFGRATFGLEKLGLEQQLAGTFETPEGGKARGSFITNKLIPAIDQQIMAEQAALAAERAKPKKKRDKDEIAERKDRLRQLELDKLQASIDAQEANTTALETVTDALKEFSGSTSFGFQGQGFTDLINAGVGA